MPKRRRRARVYQVGGDQCVDGAGRVGERQAGEIRRVPQLSARAEHAQRLGKRARVGGYTARSRVTDGTFL